MEWINPSKFYFSEYLADVKENYYSEVFQYISNNLIVESENENPQTIGFTIPNVFFLSYKTSLLIEIKKEKLQCVFSVQYQKAFNFLLIFLLAAALLSTFSMTLFLWFSLISVILFLLVQYVMLRNIFQKIFHRVLIQNFAEEELTKQQQEWINNPSTCPACGVEVSEYDSTCGECGIFIKQVQKFSRFSVTENLGNVMYNYTITNEKN
jgi:hypothetical protein